MRDDKNLGDTENYTPYSLESMVESRLFHFYRSLEFSLFSVQKTHSPSDPSKCLGEILQCTHIRNSKGQT